MSATWPRPSSSIGLRGFRCRQSSPSIGAGCWRRHRSSSCVCRSCCSKTRRRRSPRAAALDGNAGRMFVAGALAFAPLAVVEIGIYMLRRATDRSTAIPPLVGWSMACSWRSCGTRLRLPPFSSCPPSSPPPTFGYRRASSPCIGCSIEWRDDGLIWATTVADMAADRRNLPVLWKPRCFRARRRCRPGRSNGGPFLRRPCGLGVPDWRQLRYHDQGRRRPEARQARRRNRSRGEPAPCPCRRMPRRKRRSA